MSHQIEFLINRNELQTTRLSFWEVRNRGMTRLMRGVREILLEEGRLDSDWRVRIHVHDWPTPEDPPTPGLVELQTISAMGADDNLFPDWGFGGWWHMGMDEWWPFVTNLASSGESPPEDRRAFWKGAHLNVRQRERYMEVCASDPERFAGEFMSWRSESEPNNFTPMAEQCRHAVLVDLKGIGFSGRLKMLAFTGRPLIVAWRNWWCWAGQEVFRQRLHFDSSEDLSDISQRYDEICGDMNGAEMRAASLREFCMENLTFKSACLRGARLIGEAMLENSKAFGLN
jgi:hypothetical protein